jgi:arabinogalactan oligomer/maltooligosaccharide transport system permease protein
MLNPDLGTIGEFLTSVFGSSPQFFLDPMWTRIALIVVNIWLSYPYFYVVTSGAMRAIPEEQFDAAEVDGAGPWQSFRYITFPQLIVIVMPLVIASFSFNFNNFNLVYIFNQGNPPMADTIIPIGQSDILISFIYKLAFVTSGAHDYGLGAAISVALFVVIGSITWFQIRATKAMEAR